MNQPHEKRSLVINFLHGHPVGELLKCLAVEGDGNSSISIKGKLHSILNLWLSTFLHRSVRIIFIPTIKKFDNSQHNEVYSLNYNLFTAPTYNCPYLYLPDQTQRVLSNVDQAPQGFHRLVGCWCHIWKLE